MRYTLFILSALLVFVIPDQSQAQGKDPRVEIRPFVGMRLGGNVSDSGYESGSGVDDFIDDLNVKPGSQFGVMLNLPLALILPLLALGETIAFRLMPLTIGQLATFRFDGTAAPGKLSLDEPMSGVQAMIEGGAAT